MDPNTATFVASIGGGLIQAAATVLAVVWAYRRGRAEGVERSKREVASRLDRACDGIAAHWGQRDLDMVRVYNEKHDIRRLWGKRHADVFSHRATRIEVEAARFPESRDLAIYRVQQLVFLVHAWIDGAPAEGDPSYGIDGVDENRAAADKASVDRAATDKG